MNLAESMQPCFSVFRFLSVSSLICLMNKMDSANSITRYKPLNLYSALLYFSGVSAKVCDFLYD